MKWIKKEADVGYGVYGYDYHLMDGNRCYGMVLNTWQKDEKHNVWTAIVIFPYWKYDRKLFAVDGSVRDLDIYKVFPFPSLKKAKQWVIKGCNNTDWEKIDSEVDR